MILGIFIGAAAGMAIAYLLFLLVASGTSKQSIQMHKDMMEFHKLSLSALQTRNDISIDIRDRLDRIADAVECMD